MKIENIIKLSEILGEMGNIKRATKLPNHENESDSHHSFSLTLIAYQITESICPELDQKKILLFGLCHDLLEIITGDEDTLHFTEAQHAAKQAREKEATSAFDKLFLNYPDLKQAMYDYEKLDSPEAATIFVLDKACTTWTHHPHNAKYARLNNINSVADVEAWADRQRAKFKKRLKVQPPQEILEIYEKSFEELKRLYEE